MSLMTAIFSPFSKINDTVSNKLAIMPERDKRALQYLAVFFVFMLLYGVYMVHQYAGKVEKSAMTAQEQLFWMRSQASAIKSDGAVEQDDLETTIRDYAKRQRLQVNVAGNGDNVQLSISHDNATAVGRFFANLEKKGVTFQRMTMTQNEDLTIKAEATASY